MTPSSAPALDLSLFARENLVAWCIVPYDSRQRGPRERAAMLAELGLRRLGWDWRPAHVAELDGELDALAEHGIELTAIWLPAFLPDHDGGLGRLDADVERILDTLRDRGVTTQLWTSTELGPPGTFAPLPAEAHRRMVQRTAAHLGPLAERANMDGHTIALYNHLGWAGEPANLLEVLGVLLERGLRRSGLVYQQHHGHAHRERFAELLDLMRDQLLALGINGMLPGTDGRDGKVYPYGRGPRDVALARIIATSGWCGPVSILGHTMDDVADRLRDNLEGLEWVVERLRQGESDLADDDASGPPPARIPHPRWPH